MKKELFGWLLALLVAPLIDAGCQNASSSKNKNPDIAISPGVLNVAEWAKFDYKGVLAKAKAGDRQAMVQFLEFHSIVDGTDGLDHGTACLELIPFVQDFEYAKAIQQCSPKLRKLLLERFVLAQSRTKNTALHQPIAHIAPNTCAALNDQPLPDKVHPNREQTPGTPATPDSQKNEQPQPAPAPAPQTPAEPAKQGGQKSGQ